MLTKHSAEADDQFKIKPRRASAPSLAAEFGDMGGQLNTSLGGLGGGGGQGRGDKGKTVLLWNATTGDCYPVEHSFNPLQRVDVVFDENNIYGNIQEYDDPKRMSFDFGSAKDWSPFYCKKFMPATRLPSVQRPVVFATPRLDLQRELESTIDMFLRKRVRVWREARRHVTRFNPLCCSQLKAHLADFETAAVNPSTEPMLTDKFKKISESYSVRGFPINFAYVNMEDTADQVKQTHAYIADTVENEFGIAVKVFAYPNLVFSVWVYLAQMSSRR